MAFTYEELHGKTVVQLRDIAENLGDHSVLHGFSTMHKEELLPALCNVLGIDAHVHHEIIGIDKAKIKVQIRQLKKELKRVTEERDILKKAAVYFANQPD